MDIGNQFNKLQERKAMLDMLMQREASFPDHGTSCSKPRINPSWAHEFWNARLREHADVKRALGVGTATMVDHLRIYHDPFESCEPRSVKIPHDDVQQNILPVFLQGGE
jgi:hypothetical protein